VLSLDGNDEFAIDKSVLNNTGMAWKGFVFELGTGTGANFVPSTQGDGVSFFTGLSNREETGAFPDAAISEDRITFSGGLANGNTAHFVVFVHTSAVGSHLVTVRQSAIVGASAPALTPWWLALVSVLLVAFGGLRLGLRATGGAR